MKVVCAGEVKRETEDGTRFSHPQLLFSTQDPASRLPTTEVWLVICENPRDMTMTSSVDLCVFFKYYLFMYVLFSKIKVV